MKRPTGVVVVTVHPLPSLAARPSTLVLWVCTVSTLQAPAGVAIVSVVSNCIRRLPAAPLYGYGDVNGMRTENGYGNTPPGFTVGIVRLLANTTVGVAVPALVVGFVVIDAAVTLVVQQVTL